MLSVVIVRLSKVQNVVHHGRIAWRRVRSLTQIPRRPPSPVGRGNQGPRRFRFAGSNRVAEVVYLLAVSKGRRYPDQGLVEPAETPCPLTGQHV